MSEIHTYNRVLSLALCSTLACSCWVSTSPCPSLWKSKISPGRAQSLLWGKPLQAEDHCLETTLGCSIVAEHPLEHVQGTPPTPHPHFMSPWWNNSGKFQIRDRRSVKRSDAIYKRPSQAQKDGPVRSLRVLTPVGISIRGVLYCPLPLLFPLPFPSPLSFEDRI